jgi:ABC-type antimicrobial peptide transport system permease subunit
MVMLRNYLKTSVRNLLRHKSYSLINVFGLSVGLATTLFIFLWMVDELRYDQFHTDKNIYRVLANYPYTDGSIETGWATPVLLAPTMQTELPEVAQAMHMRWPGDMLVKHGDKSLAEHGVFADAAIFSVFSFPILQGDARQPLPGEKSIAISQSLATKFFGDKDPIGQVFQVDEKYEFAVTAVFADIPKASSLTFDYVLPFDVWLKDNEWAKHWGNGSQQTFVTLKPGTDIEAFNKKVEGFVVNRCEGCLAHPFVFPYDKMHLYGEFKDGKQSGGLIDYIYTLGLVALIILAIACINFMNLATARAATRSREVGVRKVIGAQRTGLVTQFITESLLLSGVAMLLALAIVQLLLPVFNLIIGKNIHLQLNDPTLQLGVFGLTLFSGLLAGSYPALFLSAFKPAAVLKGQVHSHLTGGGLRRSLVVVQFIASIVLIIGSLVVYRQIRFIAQQHLGFDRSNIVVLGQRGGVSKNQKSFKAELLQSPSIRQVSVAGENPFNIDSNTTDPAWPGKPTDATIAFRVISCDEDFIPTFSMAFAAGRNFHGDWNIDSVHYIVNEKAVRAMGLTPETALGSEFTMWNGKGKIIGVVKDFNNQHLRKGIDPLVFVYNPDNTWRIFVKITGDPKIALAHIAAVQHKFDPDYPFDYQFLDKGYEELYRTETMISQLALSFTVIAVVVSCLGLFGLAAFTAERRMKEMGVRKVLGASVLNLIVLLCSDFARLVTIALFVAFPAAWYLSQQYLAGYAFHAELTVWVFILPAVGVLILTLLTVGYQSARAAAANPVDSLRSE